jgi:glycosyltransferase involved in cell wall biosynthesis
VVFAGYRSDLWALMKAASVFVSMSSFEGNPNVVQEAMACRLPLVVSDIEAHRRVLGAGAALFVEAENAIELARAITGTLRDTSSARERAERARVIADGHSPEVAAKRTRLLYESIVRGPGSSSMFSR